MRSIATAHCEADLPGIVATLRASRARLADAVHEGSAVLVPIELPDAANLELRPVLPGGQGGVVPIVEGQLTIRCVSKCTFDVHADGPLDRLDVDYEPVSGEWRLTAAGSSIFIEAEQLDASLDTTDRQIGTQPISSRM